MSRIILSNDIMQEVCYQSSLLDPQFCRVFLSQEEEVLKEFKIEHAHEVIAEAYISSSKEKTLILGASFYNGFAQNALLKILEEPPKNTTFVLIGKNKNTFLPTVRSRLHIEDKRIRAKIRDFALDLNALSLQGIYGYLKQRHENSYEYTKQKIQSLLFSAKKAGYVLSQEELQSFDEALLASFNHQQFSFVLLPLLLMLLEKKNQR
ncbi:DNA polymerase III subunit delta' [Helicobacter mustelae]|uniref:DNA polymerase III subunit delta' n=1 Tax=Helicobacter mustelae TaxID=217 RepID=UPI000DF8DBBA|nr:DNA polymerase III subunit delta' [Helicobacter mustelae]STP12049.1 DNA polymerase III subunit delta' [Helicobacter mustelae]